LPKNNKSVEQQDNFLLFNYMFRHQVYLEGLKLYLGQQFAKVLKNLTIEFSRFILEQNKSDLGQLSLVELRKLVQKFEAEQGPVYSDYEEHIIELLFATLGAELEIGQAIFQDVNPDFDGVEDDEDSQNKLWDAITSEPIPASGALVEKQISDFTKLAAFGAVSLIRQAYSNAWTAQQTLNALIGESGNRIPDGLLGKLAGQNQALINTIVQHISQETQARIAQAAGYNKYKWVAILDNVTTFICMSRNGTIYVYGEGPLPPAHYNCRSKAIPETGEDAFAIPENYYDWISQQPEDFQNDVLGVEKADQLRKGLLTAKNFSSISTTKPLTISQFVAKIKFILED
jgi:SPP1 gp7 family putative phage head morphogenesis protein